MKNARNIVLAAATVTAFGIATAHASRVLPTVNKIDFSNGERSTFSLYEGLSSAPNGITVAAGDIDGDGVGDFATVEHWGDPHENLNGVVVRGWDGTVKGGISPPEMTTFPPRYVAMGHYMDGTTAESVLSVGSDWTAPAARYHTWRWRNATGSFSEPESVQVYEPMQGFSSDISVAIDSLSTDGYGIVIGSQEKFDHNGHVTVLKAAGTVGGSFQVSDNTYGGGVRVATGDVDGDGRSEIFTMSIGETMGSQGMPEACIDLSVIFVTGSPGPELNFTKIEFEYKPQKKGDLSIGVLPGGIAGGDVDGDGLAELIFTTSEDNGPEVKYFDFLTDGMPRFGELHDVSLAGFQDADLWNSFTVLEPSFTTAPFSPLAPEGSPLGALLLSTVILPEPATLTLLGAVGALMLRRRA